MKRFIIKRVRKSTGGMWWSLHDLQRRGLRHGRKGTHIGYFDTRKDAFAYSKAL